MTKNKIRPGCYVFPVPTVLVGANVNGKANFNTIGWVNGHQFNPPLISITSNQRHYNNIGIKENGTFSINTPSADMVEITDYCGLRSGHDEDKSEIFEVFYGELKTAPMIEKAALNLECKLIHKVNTNDISNGDEGNEIFFGEVVQAYTEEKYITEGRLDVEKIKPFVLSASRRKPRYYNLGEEIGLTYNIGFNYKKN
jgi:flavin reductase (DIM6/NTAB) family NADH-FMN oxidoreductase RutF